jgi:phenylpropionate dioxygenase-like ring-hydroxylating dioxygenase large terminal subunit
VTSREENELLTQVGPGTPMGELMRRYWQPAGLVEELAARAPVPTRLLGEDLVLFRDDQGRPGLLGIHCSHRGADLSYGRIEDGGLRCIYHGWLYDARGRCLEQPGEPAGSTFQEKIQHPAYPCIEKAGVIFAYLGPGAPPLLPAYEFLEAPEGQHGSSKVFQDSNYLQGNEGNLDPSHLSFLHRLAVDDTEAGIRQFLNGQYTSPHIETETTDFGVRIYAVRPGGVDKNYVRVTNFVLPNFAAVAGHRDGYSVNWHVPIDDEHHWRFGISFHRSAGPARWQSAIPGAGQADRTEGYYLVRNKANRYQQDREEMKAKSFIGMGANFVVHDTCATEGPGNIQDRTEEHLGYTDGGIMASRKVLLDAIRDVQEGHDPPHVIRDPSQNHLEHLFVRNDVLLPSDVDWHNYWEKEPRELVDTADLAAAGGRRRLAE